MTTLFSHPGPKGGWRTRAGWRVLPALLLCVVMAGCATSPARDPRDPFESFNRQVNQFNEAVDQAILKPVATTYSQVAPDPLRTAISNFFGNLSDIWSTLNTALQLRGEDTATNFMRVNINTVFGLGGLIDIASDVGLYRNRADFGQTLGFWGVPPGPYMVLPLLGPSTLRDTVGMGVESRGDLIMNLDNVSNRNGLYVLRAVETRAGLLRAGAVLDEAALDKYSFAREVFLQRRQNVIDEQRHREDE